MKKDKSKLCPNEDEHTPHPSGYIDHADWADEMWKTYEQIICKGCGLWAAWVPKKPKRKKR